MQDLHDAARERALRPPLPGLDAALEWARAGDVRGARSAVEAYLRTAPSDGAAHRLHAATLMHTGDLPGAIEAFQRATRFGCNDASTRIQLGLALKFRGRCADALREFERARSCDPADPLARWLASVGTLPMVFDSAAKVEAALTAFRTRLAELDDWFREYGCANAAGVVAEPNPFHIAYVERDHRDDLVRYGKLCSRLMADWNSARPHPAAPAIVRDGRRRVGIVTRYLYRHSVWSAIVKGMLQTLDRTRFRFELFHVGEQRDAETEFAKAHAAGYTPSLARTDASVDAISASAPDILFYPEIGMDPLSTRLAALRLAPLQIASWGHPITTGLPTVDIFLSAEAFEPPAGASHYTERLVALPCLGARVEREPAQAAAADPAQYGIDPRRPLFLCPGVPWKYPPEFDDALCAIAARAPDAQFVFFEPVLQRAAAAQLRRRVGARFGAAGIDPAGRIVFAPWLGRAEFLGLVSQADACLDSFGFSGFNTVLQCLQAGAPMVTLEGKFMRGRLASGVLRHVGLVEYVATDIQGYVERAVGTLTRRVPGAELSAAATRAYDDRAPMAALAKFLLSKI
ncbi:MAG: hypothetical protein GC202_05455 [Alphaproteobacteria bacterium]|nr:hypothetical protein [Alphaproteobacteria bacterium]